MQAHRRDRADLIKKLQVQVDLLRELGRMFDSGQRIMAYQVATAIRLLVHDTTSSHALLAQLGELSTMQFSDTSVPMNPQGTIKPTGAWFC